MEPLERLRGRKGLCHLRRQDPSGLIQVGGRLGKIAKNFEAKTVGIGRGVC